MKFIKEKWIIILLILVAGSLIVISVFYRSDLSGGNATIFEGLNETILAPLAYSLVLGIVAGVELPASDGVLPVYAGETLFIIFVTVPLILLFGILTVISFLVKYKSHSASKDFSPLLKATLSLILFLITMIIALNYIFQLYYNPRGIVLN